MLRSWLYFAKRAIFFEVDVITFYDFTSFQDHSIDIAHRNKTNNSLFEMLLQAIRSGEKVK